MNANFEAWLRDEQGAADLTVAAYGSDLTIFGAWFEARNGAALTPGELTAVDWNEYQRSLQDAGTAPATINRRLAALRCWVRWVMQTTGLQVDPLRWARGVKQQDLAPRWLTRPEQKAVLRELQKDESAARTAFAQVSAARDMALFMLMRYAGLRVGEVCALELGDVQINERLIVVRRGKGDKRRTVPMHPNVRRALDEWLGLRPAVESERLFIGKRGEPLTSSAVQRRVAEVGRRAGVELTPHVLRHTCAKELADDPEVKLNTVQAVLGHERLETTLRYILPGQPDLRHAIERMA